METNKTNQELEDLIRESEKALINYCIAYGKAVPTDQWVTIKEYCKRFGIEDTQTVSDWIEAGIIPEENMVIIPEFKDIRMIKAVQYNDV